MRTIIVSGGRIDYEFAAAFMRDNPAGKIIGVDRGVEFLSTSKILPTDIVGDFDSIQKETLHAYKGRQDVEIHRYPSEKDATDTELAIQLALMYGSKEIFILGGTGTRVDHLLGNIQLLSIAMEKNTACFLIDVNNRIRLLYENTVFRKEDSYGDYISFLPLTTQVEGVTLEGFKYPLKEHLLTSRESLGISNELVEAEGMVSFRSGILIAIESKD